MRRRTKYPGVFYRDAKRIGGRGTERVYYAVFRKGGKLFEEKVGRQFVDDMTPARVAGIRAELIEGKRLTRKEAAEKKAREASKLTVTILWQKYKDGNPQIRNWKPDTSRFETYIKPALGKKEPQAIMPLEVDRLRLQALKGKSPQTVKLTLSLLNRIVNYGVKKKISLPMTFRIQMPKVDNITTEDLSDAAMKKLLAVMEADPDRLGASAMLLALLTGLRRGEILNLKWSDIDRERGFITIRNPKGGKTEAIPMSKPVEDLMEQVGEFRVEKNPFVFPGRKGKRTDFRNTTKRIKAAAGLPKDFRRFHGMRHVFASALASSGEVDLYTLQRLLTHKDANTTQRYAHLRDESLRKASTLAGEIVKKSFKHD